MKDIESYSNSDLQEELEARCYRNNLRYDYVDCQLYDDIVETFDSLSCAKRQKLRDTVINFKENV